MKSSLISRVDSLIQLIQPKKFDFFYWDKTYDFLRAWELCTAPGPPEWTKERWEKEFIKNNGTREEFIKAREEIYNDRF